MSGLGPAPEAPEGALTPASLAQALAAASATAVAAPPPEDPPAGVEPAAGRPPAGARSPLAAFAAAVKHHAGATNALLALTVAVGAVVATTPAFSSSARPLLEAWLPEPPATAALLRPLAQHAGAQAGILALRCALALGVIGMLVALAHQLAGAWAARLALVVLLLWPPARAAATTISAEAALATAALALALAAALLTARPRSAAALGAAALVVVAFAHPLGLVATAPAVVLLAMVPAAHHRSWPRAGVAAGPRWLAWLAALTLAAGLARALLPDGRGAALWLATVEVLRAPAAAGGPGADTWPLVGPLAALAGRLPPLLGLFALVALQAGLRGRALAGREEGAAALATTSWVVAGWLALIALVGRPTPQALDPLPVVAPALVALAAAALVALARAARRALRPTWAVALPVAALLAGVAAEGVSAAAGDARTLLGRLLPLTSDADADLPAVIDGEALDLLALVPGEVAVWPGRRDGDALLTTLVRVGLAPSGLRACSADRCGRVLLRRPMSGVQAAAWADLTVEIGRAGAWSLRERPKPPPPSPAPR